MDSYEQLSDLIDQQLKPTDNLQIACVMHDTDNGAIRFLQRNLTVPTLAKIVHFMFQQIHTDGNEKFDILRDDRLTGHWNSVISHSEQLEASLREIEKFTKEHS